MKTRYIILYFRGQGDFTECPKIDDLCSVNDTTIIVKDCGMPCCIQDEFSEIALPLKISIFAF